MSLVASASHSARQAPSSNGRQGKNMRRKMNPRSGLSIPLSRFPKFSRRPFNVEMISVGFSSIDQYFTFFFPNTVNGNSSPSTSPYQHGLLPFSSFPRNLILTTLPTSLSFQGHTLLLMLGYRKA